MSESARSVLKHLYQEGRMTEEQYQKIDRNLKEPQWIPCFERLPKERGYYLVTTDGSHNYVIDIAEYDFDWRGGDFILEWHKASKILAWMPLPERYKEEAFRKYNGLKEGDINENF